MGCVGCVMARNERDETSETRTEGGEVGEGRDGVVRVYEDGTLRDGMRWVASEADAGYDCLIYVFRRIVSCR